MGYGIQGGSLTGPQNTASLKGKCAVIDNEIDEIIATMNMYKKEVLELKHKKETLVTIMSNKTKQVKANLTADLSRVEEEMKRHFAHQKAENSRLQQQITSMKGEKTNLQQQMHVVQRRIAELERQVGDNEEPS